MKVWTEGTQAASAAPPGRDERERTSQRTQIMSCLHCNEDSDFLHPPKPFL
jgi:hypothetical protein